MASRRYLDMLEAMKELHVAKSLGYGGRDAETAWSNFHRARVYGLPASTGCLIRLSDKVTRMEALIRDPGNDVLVGAEHTGPAESLRDTVRDLAAYALIYLCLLDEEAAGVDEKPYWPPRPVIGPEAPEVRYAPRDEDIIRPGT